MTFKPEKAYKNLSFLNSAPARTVRILCEYEEPRQRFMQHGVKDTIVVFGSARARPLVEVQPLFDAAEAAHASKPTEETAGALKVASRALRLAGWYESARELSKRLTEWSMGRQTGRRYTLCTGGGPGMMEASNRGAADVPGGRSVGLGISLPFEPGVNPYVTRELGFEFHYFFTRKLWFMYLMRACVLFPGGFGTFDEFFELLTLLQTGKVKRRVPILLFGSVYWKSVLNLDALVEYGTVSPKDVELFQMVDTVDEAFTLLVTALEEVEGKR